MATTDLTLEEMTVVAVASMLSWLLNRFMSKRNERGRCATCGDTLDIYSKGIDAFRGDSFEHCPSCIHKIRFVRVSLALLIIGLVVAAIYFSLA
jgi:hypothetical protein